MNADNEKKVLKLNEFGFEIEKLQVKPKKSQKRLGLLVNASEMGFSIALPIVLGVLFGVWLDKKFNTQPKLTLSFLMLGVFFSFANLYLIIKEFTRKDGKDKKEM